MKETTEPPKEPGAIAWLIAFISLILPWIGGALALAGAFRLSEDLAAGAFLLATGLAMIALDLLIDLWWAHPAVTRSAEPMLNARSAQLVERVLVVEEAIINGRGKVRAGDTLWACEGPDCAAGTTVRVTRAEGVLLHVAKL